MNTSFVNMENGIKEINEKVTNLTANFSDMKDTFDKISQNFSLLLPIDTSGKHLSCFDCLVIPKSVSICTLRSLLEKQSILSEQGSIFLENQLGKQAELSKQGGIFLQRSWAILRNNAFLH